MARGVNKVILIGNLGGDPELRYTPNGSAVANANVATTETHKKKLISSEGGANIPEADSFGGGSPASYGSAGSQQQSMIGSHTEWHRVVFFGRLAEIVGEYLRKGSKIYIEGSLRTRKWKDKNGIERHTTEVIANEMHILDSRSNRTDKPAEEGIGAFDHHAQSASYKQHAPVPQEEFVEDDIPF